MKQLILAVTVAASFGYQVQTPPQTPPPPPKPAQVQQSPATELALAAIDSMEKLSDAIGAKKRFQCMSAVGHPVFCSCLEANLPLGVDFTGYVAITTDTPSGQALASLTDEQKGMVKTTMAARDKCVIQAFRPK